MKTPGSAPSATSWRKMFGIRNAAQKTSLDFPAPKNAAIAMLRR